MYFLSDGVALYLTKDERKKSKKQKTKSKRQKAKSKSAGVTQEVRMYFLRDAYFLNDVWPQNNLLLASLRKYIGTYQVMALLSKTYSLERWGRYKVHGTPCVLLK